VSADEKLAKKAEKVQAWLELLFDPEKALLLESEVYADLISRREETSSLSGFHTPSLSDPGPRTRPCECRPPWLRGRLCLACENTGWRRLAPGEEGIDPYSAQVPKRSSFLLVEADSTKKAAAQARMDNEIDALRRLERIREGFEAMENRDLRDVRILDTRRYIPMLRRLEAALKALVAARPEALRAPRELLARAVARLMGRGRLYWPPLTA
jgi:hypothetical protein